MLWRSLRFCAPRQSNSRNSIPPPKLSSRRRRRSIQNSVLRSVCRAPMHKHSPAGRCRSALPFSQHRWHWLQPPCVRRRRSSASVGCVVAAMALLRRPACIPPEGMHAKVLLEAALWGRSVARIACEFGDLQADRRRQCCQLIEEEAGGRRRRARLCGFLAMSPVFAGDPVLCGQKSKQNRPLGSPLLTRAVVAAQGPGMQIPHAHQRVQLPPCFARVTDPAIRHH